MISDLYQPYTAHGTPQTVWAYEACPVGSGRTRAAVVVYACYIRDPLYEREPTADEVRQIVEYCAYFIHAPCLFVSDELCALRETIVYVETAEQLAGWLWGCASIGLGYVLGGL